MMRKGSWARQSSCWQLGSLYRGYLQWVLHWYSTEDHARWHTGQHRVARVEWYEQRSGQIKRDQQASIHLRTGACFLYQDEDSKTCIAYSSPINSFLIYDDTVAHKAVAFVMYWHDDNNNLTGKVYRKDGIYALIWHALKGQADLTPFNEVPAVEFFMNTERQGIFENVETLINALDKVLSQKANQNEYFDNAYLVLKGLKLDEDDEGNPKLDLNGNQIIYAPDADSAQRRSWISDQTWWRCHLKSTLLIASSAWSIRSAWLQTWTMKHSAAIVLALHCNTNCYQWGT